MMELVRALLRSAGIGLDGRMLEVGCGVLRLEGVWGKYFGSDISIACGRHGEGVARFSTASAEALPFVTGSFDLVLSIFVLEHVPNPGKALEEIRRVARPGSVIILKPAWFCRPWTGRAWFWKRASELRWTDRVKKTLVPLRNAVLFRGVHLLIWRMAGLCMGAAGLRFRRLEPNYGMPEVEDSDAEVWLDPLDFIRWFEARGDECISHRTFRQKWLRTSDAVVVRVGGRLSADSANPA